MTQVEEDKVMVLMDGKNLPPSLSPTIPRSLIPRTRTSLRNAEPLQYLPVLLCFSR